MRYFSDDENSVRLLKNGDIAGFNLLYKRYRATLFANIFKLVKDVDLASDILQEVFVTIWQNREKIDEEKSFQNLLFSISRNKVYDFFRKASRDLKLQDKLINAYKELEYNPLDRDYHLKEDVKALNQEIENLPEKCKEVFKLCKIEGRSYDEVAKLLNISPATINNHIVKATKILKQKFAHLSLALFFLLFFEKQIVDSFF